MCVRCGSQPRDNNVLLCRTCRSDPATTDEVMEAMTRHGLRVQRHYLVDERGWYGHWRTPNAQDAAGSPEQSAAVADEAVAKAGRRQGDARTAGLHPAAGS